MDKTLKCLVLNSDYTPLSIIHYQKGLILLIKKQYYPNLGIEFIEFYNHYIQTPKNKIKIPSVIKTTKYYKIQFGPMKFSRKNIFLRDNYTCQYCGHQKSITELTYDHIIPKSQWDYSKGDPTHWLNITTACVKCNRKKGDKNPEQAGMSILNKPHIPSKTMKHLPSMSQDDSICIPAEWLIYI